LITGNGTGCKDTLVSPNPVIVGTMPVPSFTASNTTGCPPLPVQFTNNSLNTDSTTTFTWNLGNGLTTTGDEPAHIYQLPGIYTVTLTAVNNGVCTASYVLNNFINVNDGTPPPPVLLKVSA
ncbi:MAG: PKD domain-containing protein, partial [Bacteroidetes bacterium]|nr:PKD domain-containing protein [Bacteroidota bacterium]